MMGSTPTHAKTVIWRADRGHSHKVAGETGRIETFPGTSAHFLALRSGLCARTVDRFIPLLPLGLRRSR